MHDATLPAINLEALVGEVELTAKRIVSALKLDVPALRQWTPKGEAHAEKKAKRQAFRAVRAGLKPEVRRRASKAMVATLLASNAAQQARTVMIYAALADEVNLDELVSPLTRAGKRVAFPRLTKTPGVMTLWAIRTLDALIDGPHGIRTPDVARAVPIEPKDVDLVIAPGVSYTRQGVRLGQGGGYYDRLLARLPKHAKTVGVCFDAQLADALPREAHDVAVHAVLTEHATYGETLLTEAAPVVAVPPQFVKSGEAPLGPQPDAPSTPDAVVAEAA